MSELVVGAIDPWTFRVIANPEQTSSHRSLRGWVPKLLADMRNTPERAFKVEKPLQHSMGEAAYAWSKAESEDGVPKWSKRLAGVALSACTLMVAQAQPAYAERPGTVVENTSDTTIALCEGDGGRVGGYNVCEGRSLLQPGASVTVPAEGTKIVLPARKKLVNSTTGDQLLGNCWSFFEPDTARKIVRFNPPTTSKVVQPKSGGGFSETRYVSVALQPCDPPKPRSKPKTNSEKSRNNTSKDSSGCEFSGILADVFCAKSSGSSTKNKTKPKTNSSQNKKKQQPKKPASFWEDFGKNFQQSKKDKKRGQERRRNAVGMIGLEAMQIKFTTSDGRQVTAGYQTDHTLAA